MGARCLRRSAPPRCCLRLFRRLLAAVTAANRGAPPAPPTRCRGPTKSDLVLNPRNPWYMASSYVAPRRHRAPSPRDSWRVQRVETRYRHPSLAEHGAMMRHRLRLGPRLGPRHSISPCRLGSPSTLLASSCHVAVARSSTCACNRAISTFGPPR